MARSKWQLAIKGPRWERVRQVVLRRDKWTCQRCGHWGNECDHIIPLSTGGAAYDVANIQVLCVRCHYDKSSREQSQSPERAAWRSELQRMVANASNS